MPRTKNETYQSQFRLSEESLADLVSIKKWLTEERGTEQTRSDAVRFAIHEAAKKIQKKGK